MSPKRARVLRQRRPARLDREVPARVDSVAAGESTPKAVSARAFLVGGYATIQENADI